MKFLIDNQLPDDLASYLGNRGFDCQHVLDVGLARSLDSEICRYAELEGRVIVTKDEDFFYLAQRPQPKIRVLWVRLGNCRTSLLLETFERLWPMIESRLHAGDQIIEIR